MTQIPQRIVDSFAGLKENWRTDMVSGFLVFLIALPLCLGVAMASGFPPMAGIISAVIGGILVSRLNGSQLTVNGPAAGLIVVILSAVQSLGQGDALAGYRCTLAAIVIAGALQILLGIYQAGRLSAFFPVSVVHGMLAAIGIIIMATPVHVLLGVDLESGGVLSAIAQIPRSLFHLDPEIAFIGLAGLLILIFWPRLDNPYLKSIPAPLVVIVIGTTLGRWFDVEHEHLYVVLSSVPGIHHLNVPSREFLVSIPDDFWTNFYFPDFSKIGHLSFWAAVVGICLVGSLESLLACAAVDKLDPENRQSDMNRDLKAVGIGNSLCGLIGGLPLIAEIVRSSANIDNGAKTAWANFFHGVFMLSFVALLPDLIRGVPLASLAALLVYTGFRLASPRAFAETMEIGIEQLALFVITIIGVLATDLLLGVSLGILAKFLLLRWHGVRFNNLLQLSYRITPEVDGAYRIKVNGAAVFSNFLALKSELAALPTGETVVFDLTYAYLIDHTVMDFIDHYCQDYIARGGQCEIRGLDRYETSSEHPLAARRRKALK